MRLEQGACEIVCAALRATSRVVNRVTGERVVASLAMKEPRVALTIDDGPHPTTTPGLLSALRRHHSRATFFLIGERIAASAHLAEQIVADGHEVAIHLMRDEPSIRLPPHEFAGQLRRVAQLMPPDAPVRFFRPGSGWFNSRMLHQAGELGYACAMGTPLLTTERYPDPEEVGRRLARRAHAGAIIVLHEGTAERAGVVPASEALLIGLAARRLKVVTLSELAK